VNEPYIAIGGWNSTSVRADEFDAAFEGFRTVPILILDVRMNGGGEDQLAFQIAGRFATSSVTTGYVKLRWDRCIRASGRRSLVRCPREERGGTRDPFCC
jgi:C-terminal processing protease CtpA/Prc